MHPSWHEPPQPVKRDPSNAVQDATNDGRRPLTHTRTAVRTRTNSRAHMPKRVHGRARDHCPNRFGTVRPRETDLAITCLTRIRAVARPPDPWHENAIRYDNVPYQTGRRLACARETDLDARAPGGTGPRVRGCDRAIPPDALFCRGPLVVLFRRNTSRVLRCSYGTSEDSLREGERSRGFTRGVACGGGPA